MAIAAVAVTVVATAAATKTTSLSRSQHQENTTLVAMLHQRQVQTLQPVARTQKNRQHLQQ
jgi:FixJ family two-component response regulator